MAKLTPQDEVKFRKWYSAHAKKTGLNKNPDDKRHHYNYRGAYKAGSGPDKTGHWPSKHKRKTHPRLVLKGVNTKTGKKVK